jgi:ATP-binding cassette subfamily C protein LapB
MGPALFAKGAEQAGYKTKNKKVALSKIDPALFPVVLLMKDDQALVLIERQADSSSEESYLLYDPASDQEKKLSFGEIAKAYSGHCILIYPDHKNTLEQSGHNQKITDDVLPLQDKTGLDDDPVLPKQQQRKWFYKIVWENRGLYRKVIIASILINLFALASPLFIMNVYDRVIPNSAIETGWVLALAVLIVFVFDFVIRNLRGYFTDLAGRKIDVIAAQRIYDQVLDVRLAKKPASSGVFASMLKDFDAVKDFFTSATMTGFVDLPFSLLFIFVIYLLCGPIAFILLGLMICTVVMGLFLQLPLRALIRKSIQSAEAKHGLLVETISALETIKSIRADGSLRARYQHYAGEAASVAQKSRFFSGLGVHIATFLQQSATVLIVLAGMYLIRDGSMTMGGLIASVILGGRAIAPMAQVAGLLTRYHQARASLKNLSHFMALPAERPSHKNYVHRPSLSGQIEVKDVSFGYSDQGNDVLKALNISVKKGEKIGIIGRVGSGKTTLAKILSGLYFPDKGSVLMDGTDYRQIDPADIRRDVGYIAQDVILFAGSVRDNIIVSRPKATEEEILNAAEQAGVMEFVSKSPRGFDTMIGERGEGLSGGQKQAIALARLIIAQPNIIICDEPSNAMDTQSEEHFVAMMGHFAKDKTLFLITHRHSLLRIVDRLIVMNDGQVLHDGPRDDVIKTLNQQVHDKIKSMQAQNTPAKQGEPRANIITSAMTLTSPQKPQSPSDKQGKKDG